MYITSRNNNVNQHKKTSQIFCITGVINIEMNYFPYYLHQVSNKQALSTNLFTTTVASVFTVQAL